MGACSITGRMSRDDGVPDYLRKANVCCYPSHMETFGIAAVEAMSVGKPTIFSRHGPGPEITDEGVSGLLCDPHCTADIAAKINAGRIIQRSRKRWDPMPVCEYSGDFDRNDSDPAQSGFLHNNACSDNERSLISTPDALRFRRQFLLAPQQSKCPFFGRAEVAQEWFAVRAS